MRPGPLQYFSSCLCSMQLLFLYSVNVIMWTLVFHCIFLIPMFLQFCPTSDVLASWRTKSKFRFVILFMMSVTLDLCAWPVHLVFRYLMRCVSPAFAFFADWIVRVLFYNVPRLHFLGWTINIDRLNILVLRYCGTCLPFWCMWRFSELTQLYRFQHLIFRYSYFVCDHFSWICYTNVNKPLVCFAHNCIF